MIRHLYVTTEDHKGRTHSYKLRDGEGVPPNEEVTNMSVAGQWKLSELLPADQQELLRLAFPRSDNSKQRRRAKRAQA